MSYRVNSAVLKHNPLTSILIPRNDDQVFFANPLWHLIGVIGKGKGYRWAKGSTSRTGIIDQSNNTRICR